MKKPYTHLERDPDRVCETPGCGTHLKKNVVARKPAARHCYQCGRALWRAKQAGKPTEKNE